MAIDQRLGLILPIEWRKGYSKSFDFKTEIILSRNGTEQRIAQRVEPRLTYEFTGFLDHRKLREVIQFISEDQARKIYTPDPHRIAVLDSLITEGSTIPFSLDKGHTWLSDDMYVFLDDGVNQEIAHVAQMVNSTLGNLADTTLNSFNPGTRIYYAVPGYFSQESGAQALTSRVGTTDVSFIADPVLAFHDDYSTAPAETLNGREYLVFSKQWAVSLDLQFEQVFDSIDTQKGPITRYYPEPFTTRKSKLNFVIKNADDLDRILGLFYRSRGRQKSFYAPTFLDEIRPNAAISATSFSFIVGGRETYDTFSTSTVYKYLRIETENEVLTKELISVTLDGSGDSVLTFSTQFTNTIELAEIKSIMWVTKSRFESDNMLVSWLTDTVAEVSVTIRTLEDIA